ncbi:MAG: sulfopyruvate decarboxylase subunit alpha [Pseudomonadota bacterium]|jgi:sulfopyruvate decarboxylase subunit alpha|nr:sulfopyruvate decarboxylase subunit alpha [Pseudomonadota bacterium]
MTGSLSYQIIEALKQKEVSFFTSVPCKLLANMIALLEQDTSVIYQPATREDEGLGLCAGASLGGKTACILMQDSGIGTIVNALAALVQFYQLPLIMLVSYRGSPGEAVPAQAPMGMLTPELLKLMQIPTLLCHQSSDLRQISEYVDFAQVKQGPVVILLDFHLMAQDH